MRGLTERERDILECSAPGVDLEWGDECKFSPVEMAIVARLERRGLLVEVEETYTDDDGTEWYAPFNSLTSTGRLALRCDLAARTYSATPVSSDAKEGAK